MNNSPLIDEPESIPPPPRKACIPFTPELRERVLDLIAIGYNLTSAARYVGVAPRTVQYHQANDPTFAQAISAARDWGIDHMEDLMRQKALDPKNGFLALMAWLRAHRPDKWTDRAQERTIDRDSRPNISITINVPSLAELPEALRQIVPGDIQMLPESVDNADSGTPYDAENHP